MDRVLKGSCKEIDKCSVEQLKNRGQIEKSCAFWLLYIQLVKKMTHHQSAQFVCDTSSVFSDLSSSDSVWEFNRSRKSSVCKTNLSNRHHRKPSHIDIHKYSRSLMAVKGSLKRSNSSIRDKTYTAYTCLYHRSRWSGMLRVFIGRLWLKARNE